MRDKDDEVIGLKERIKRTEIELKAALERYEELKNQDTRSRGLYQFRRIIISKKFHCCLLFRTRVGVGA